MATYKGIQGYSVQTVSSDPSPTASVEGQLWYNSTSSTYKIAMSGAGAWASDGTRNTLVQGTTAAGSQTAAIASGGSTAPGPLTANAETYNGSTWTEVANLNTARYKGCGAGTTTAALNIGGTDNLPPGKLAINELYNGTSWTEIANLLVANTGQAQNVGISTAALCVGSGSLPSQDSTESWNGTSWSEVADLTTGRQDAAASGLQGAALCFGGRAPSLGVDLTETWNGTSWAEVADLNTARTAPGSAMAASNTTSLCFGGGPPAVAVTESWNGTSWTEVGDLATARYKMGGAGTGTAALAIGGIVSGTPTIMGTTEVFDSPVYSVKTVTVS